MAALRHRRSAPSSNSSNSSSLPGMKRGIGIGVVASLTIIIIAVVTYLALRRRRRLKEKASQPSQEQRELHTEQLPQPPPGPPQQQPPPIFTDYSPGLPDKKFPQCWQYWRPVEADARSIHELDASSPVPELPTKMNVPELEAISIERSPRRSPRNEEDAMVTRQSQGTLLKDWAQWSSALESSSSSSPPEETFSSQTPAIPSTPSTSNGKSTLRRSPTVSVRDKRKDKRNNIPNSSSNRPQLALLSTQRMSTAKDRISSVGSLSPLASGGGAMCSSAGVSPLAVSPLSEVYLPARPQSAGRMA